MILTKALGCSVVFSTREVNDVTHIQSQPLLVNDEIGKAIKLMRPQ